MGRRSKGADRKRRARAQQQPKRQEKPACRTAQEHSTCMAQEHSTGKTNRDGRRTAQERRAFNAEQKRKRRNEEDQTTAQTRRALNAENQRKRRNEEDQTTAQTRRALNALNQRKRRFENSMAEEIDTCSRPERRRALPTDSQDKRMSDVVAEVAQRATEEIDLHLKQLELRFEAQRNSCPAADGGTSEEYNWREDVDNEVEDQIAAKRERRRLARESKSQAFRDTFMSAIQERPNVKCENCNRMNYKNGTSALNITPAISRLYADHNWQLKSDRMTVCNRCRKKLDRKRPELPGQSLANRMHVEPAPPELTNLTMVERRLISRVQPYMKIVRGYNVAQPHLHGQAVHFAQQIEEVAEQLPLTLPDAAVVFVCEELTEKGITRNFHVRPGVLNSALEWLVRNNPLYANLRIVDAISMDFEEDAATVVSSAAKKPKHSLITAPVGSVQQPVRSRQRITDLAAAASAFKTLSPSVQLLRATWSQACKQRYNWSSGSQCMANAAVALVAASQKAVHLWTTTDLDDILDAGDEFYRTKRTKEHRQHPFLMAPEINGDLTFKGVTVTINTSTYDALSSVFPPAYAAIPAHFLGTYVKLDEALHSSFGYSPYLLLTLEGKQSTIAIHRSESGLLIFDSHPHGAKGNNRLTNPHDGKASAVLISGTDQLQKAIQYIQDGYQEKVTDERKLTVVGLHRFLIEIQPVMIAVHPQEPPLRQIRNGVATDGAVIENGMQCLSQNRIDRLLAELDAMAEEPEQQEDKEEDEGDANVCDPFQKEIDDDGCDGAAVRDCVMYPTDVVQPNVLAAIATLRNASNYKLTRKTQPPLQPFFEKRLEELSFPLLFPNGVGGFDEPRRVKISALDYAQARVMGPDERFQQPEFLFYALSRMEEEKIAASINVCRGITRPTDHSAGMPSAVQFSVFMQNMRGYSAYWKKARSDLTAMIENIGPPTWFLTLSANDMGWKELLLALIEARYGSDQARDLDSLTFDDKKKRLVDDYPKLCAQHFSLRLRNFIFKVILADNMIFGGKVLDYFVRIEFQARGSPHAHCLLWIEDPPSFYSENGIVMIDDCITRWLPPPEHPLHDVIKLQLHKHKSTCYKKCKTGEEKQCRFNFPRAPATATEILSQEIAIERGVRPLVLRGAIENPKEVDMNPYSLPIQELWQANTDLQPVGDMDSLAAYMMKYVTKDEPQACAQEIRNVLADSNGGEQDNGKKMRKIAKILQRHRCISTQEAVYRICHLPLRLSTRQCVFLNTSRPELRARMVKKDVASSLTKEAIGLDVLNPKDDALFCMNIIDRYMKRPLVLEDCSLWRFAREWQTARKSQAVDRDSDNEDDDEEDHFAAENPRLRQETLLLLDGKTYIRKRTKDAVVKRYCIDQDKDPEGYAYSILLLFMPFRDEAELTVGFNCAVDAFIGNDSKLTDLETRERLEEISRALKKALESRAEKSADSRPLPQDPEIACADGGEEYGGVIEPYHDDRPIEERRASHEATLDSLQDRQRLAYQKVKDRVAEVAQNPDDNHPLRLFITGGGGTGKSYLLRAMSEIVDICLTTSGRKSFMIVAPTGVAAKNVGGTTLHRAFYLGVEKGGVAPYYALGGPKLESARDEWAAVKFLFVEEISMVSYQAFANIDTRLREVKEQDVPFGGLNVIAFGDLMQLPPVFGDWIFVQPRARLGEEHLWRLLDYVELDVNMRQKGDHRLRDLCNSIREGVVTEADISLLESRLLENLEASAFDDAIRIVPTVIEAQRYNASVLCKLDDELAAMNKRLYRIYAKDKMVSPDGREVEADPRFIPKKDKDCAGLPSCLIIGERCRVMLIRNLYLPSGLVNGSTGSVERIEWTRLQRSQGVVGDLPAGVWVRFDDPNSAKFPGAKDGLVFIEPVDVTYDTKAGRTFKRRMIPLILCYAVTVHKMQGVTVSKAVCRLGIEIFAKGQIYVALSRVTSLDGLAIEVLCKSKFLGDEKQRRKAILADDVAMAEMSRLRNLHSTPLNDEAHFSQEF